MIVCDNSTAAMPKQMQSVCDRVPAAFLAALLLAMSMQVAVADQDLANAAGMEEVVSMRSLLARVSESYPGRVLEVELEREEDGEEVSWVYEVKLLTDRGRVLKLEYDAVNLELLKIKRQSEN